MNDHTGIEAGVAVRGGSVPNVHAHARLLTIGRRGEVGIVGTRAVLGVKDDLVVAATAGTVIVHLEVASSLVEPKNVKQVVVSVGNVEQLSD